MTDTEKAALERRIDELCAEVERLHSDQAHWELGNCPSCPNIADLQEALEQNAKLRLLVRDMYKSMNISCQFSHAIPAGTMAHIKNRVIGLGVEVDE